MSGAMEERPWHRFYPPHVPREIAIDERETLITLVEEAFTKYAERVAASCQGEQLTFAELAKLSSGFAGFLRQAGLEPGDRVALMMPNSLAFLVGMLGTLRADIVVVTVNPLYTPREVKLQLIDSGARCIVVAEPFASTVADVLPETAVKVLINAPVAGLRTKPAKSEASEGPIKTIDLHQALATGEAHPAPPSKARRGDVAFLQYTGGTTGASKGAKLTHGSVAASLAQLRSWSGFSLEGPDGSVVTPLPLYHVYPLAISLMAIVCGAANRLISNPRDIPTVIAELSRKPFELLIGVNTLFNALVQSPALRDIDFSRTRLVTGAGASVQTAVANRWREAGGPAITEGYGLTETSPSATFNLPGRNGCIGMPVPSTDVKVIDDSGNLVATGTPGELLIRGPQLFSGYWNRDEETRQAFTSDGWFKTGDIVVMDDTGTLTIVDRKKDMILVSGFNVYPNEIEGVVAGMAGVLECACIGVADERSGEAPHLFVVPRDPNLKPEAIEAHCRANLAAYKVPRRITLVNSLPKSAVGKILRRELRT
jgi:long-chain acyl-CoA synthetase